MRDRRLRSGMLAMGTGVVMLVAAGCGGSEADDVDLDQAGTALNDDGAAIIEEFRTDEPRMGEVTAETVVDDATTDHECADGVQRVWHTDFTLVWPGDPADADTVDTYFDGTTDFVAGRFRDLGYETESQELGDGDQPRSAIFRRADDDVTVKFTVDFRLAAEQGDAETVSADFSVVGSTSCVES
ncbi:hypothetical protein G1H11_18775 [Phytoactinopolyspora alkaliphila]|uniref:Uncharacterized protein n=1 Tax=Phytoactinopolyspora alkaliphila TaxID=1783498 RepID=A0A6N9YQY3_9ACTN|nr:hypothetical protein [Phytoactinopolyspora alkaliphila]NED97345.1 hypothetical protein [Phytoactinopolyspora alkaliphila]